MKIKTIFMFLILLVSMLTIPQVNAVNGIMFNEIEVNDVDVTNGGIVAIERGEDLDIRVELQSAIDYDDVRVKASVEGYEYDNIDYSTKIFDVEGSTGIYIKYLHLNLPSDIDAGDYALNLEIANPTGSKDVSGIVLQIREGRHNLLIQDVIMRPGYKVEAGRPLAVEVRVENMGSRKEEDIKVNVKIPDLGVGTRAYIDELSNSEVNENSDETSDSVIVYLPIPSDATSGEYDVEVDVEYNRGHDVVSTKSKVYIQGSKQISDINTIISIDAVSKEVKKGEVVNYRLMLANLDNYDRVYSLEVLGTESWADVSLSPGFVTVSPNGAGELILSVRPKVSGEHSFILNVKQDDEVLRDITLKTNVFERKQVSVKNVLEVGFAVLIALLVILGLIVAFKKLGKKEEESDVEPVMDDSQSYY